jgi:glycerophosphoryl diester phosphodiesterase
LPELPRAFLGAPIAHRGLHDRARGIVENSRAAVAAAVEGGFGVEIDIQIARDGEAMVFHDATLARLTGLPGMVAEHTAAELAGFELAGGGETIPTLAEILHLVDGRVPLLIEVKDQDGHLGAEVGPLERRVAALLAGYAGPVAVMSFNPHSVAVLAEAAPGVARGLTSCDFEAADWPLPDYRRAELADLRDFAPTGSTFISHNHRELANPAVHRLKAEGVPVLCWTVRSPEAEAAARRVADNITFEGYPPGH